MGTFKSLCQVNDCGTRLLHRHSGALQVCAHAKANRLLDREPPVTSWRPRFRHARQVLWRLKHVPRGGQIQSAGTDNGVKFQRWLHKANFCVTTIVCQSSIGKFIGSDSSGRATRQRSPTSTRGCVKWRTTILRGT